ncbi:MAG: Uma2 family endonuclease [Synechococcaceae cyanobacterium]|nr:Uma2 family endonuclease [Synechococcaceae cyanobacterium]
MLAPASPEAPPASLPDCPGPPCPGLLSPEQPFGSITLPLIHSGSLRLTPEQFAALCQANPDAVLELAADGALICMTPTGSDTGARNAELSFRIKSWARATGGWKAFDSSTGFRLPDDSVLSPDASLVALDRWQSLTAEQRRGFAPLCPDLVVELASPSGASPSGASPSGASPSDEGPRGLTALRQKMAAYQRNGARLGWLLIPEERAVEVWELLADPQAQPRRIEAATRLEGDAQFAGLALELEEIWAG